MIFMGESVKIRVIFGVFFLLLQDCNIVCNRTVTEISVPVKMLLKLTFSGFFFNIDFQFMCVNDSLIFTSEKTIQLVISRLSVKSGSVTELLH